jgi:hypothetical protein
LEATVKVPPDDSRPVVEAVFELGFHYKKWYLFIIVFKTDEYNFIFISRVKEPMNI